MKVKLITEVEVGEDGRGQLCSCIRNESCMSRYTIIYNLSGCIKWTVYTIWAHQYWTLNW